MERDRERDRHRDRERERDSIRDRERDIDRERERDRGRFDRRRGETTRIGAGESYKPYGSRPRSPLRVDNFRSKRDRSPRRERARSPPNSWHLNNGRDRSPRRRSRTPPRRDRTPPKDNWRARSPRRRTPPRRFSPRREDDRRVRSPLRRDERRNSRSPCNDRLGPRVRSPIRRVSPPLGPRGFRPRSRSPIRREIPKGPSVTRRRRSHTPPIRDSDKPALTMSGDTSRRSSPPNYLNRTHVNQSQSQQRSPLWKTSPAPSHKEKEPMKPPPRERPLARPTAPRSPPRGPAGFRAPTGPGTSRNFTTPGSISSNITTAPLASRPKIESSGPVAPPAGPRGYIPRGGSSVRGGRNSFVNDRGNKSDTSSRGTAPINRNAPGLEPIRVPSEPHKSGNTPNSHIMQTSSPSLPSTPLATSAPGGGSTSGVPTGPRAGVSSRPILGYQHSSSIYGRSARSVSVNNGTRSQITLTNTVSIIPSGRIDPTATGIASDIAMRLKRKEEEEEALRAELHAKEEKLRQSLKHWDKLSRDSKAMGLRSDLSEQHVRTLAGESIGGGAF